MQKQEYLYKGPNHAANLNNMRLKDKYCDVTINVSGKEVRAHKVILAANLKYFETMFSSDYFQESQGGVITMQSIHKADLELFVSYAYTGEILLTEDNALNLLELANYLSEDGIKEACVEFLEQHLRAEEAFRAYKFSSAIDCLSLKNTAKAKIITNFGNCSKSADYLNLDSGSLVNMLSDGKTHPNQMQKIFFEGILRWIVHDAKDRKNFMEDLLRSIDITKLKGDDVTSCLYKNLALCNDEYGISKDTIFFYEARKIERKTKEKVLMVMDNAPSFQFYNFIEKKWSSQQNITSGAVYSYASSTVLNDKLYFINKISGESCLQVFDPISKQITRLHSSSNILSFAALSACSRFLYICGGIKKDDSRSDQVLKYDPQNDSFESLSPMTRQRSSAAAIFYEDSLYVLGGLDDSSYLQLVEKYDFARNEWTTLAFMCKKRGGHAVAILEDKLYVCGGYTKNLVMESSVEVYDPAKNSWQLVGNMNETRKRFLLVTHEGKLLAIGGLGKRTVELYDPSKNQWEVDHEMSSGLPENFRLSGLFSASCVIETE